MGGLVGCLVGWLVGWLVAWLFVWLVGWLVGWLWYNAFFHEFPVLSDKLFLSVWHAFAPKRAMREVLEFVALGWPPATV